MVNLHGFKTVGLERRLERATDILVRHATAELAGRKVKRAVAEHLQRIEPAPTYHLRMAEVGRTQLVPCLGRMRERNHGLHQHEGRTGN